MEWKEVFTVDKPVLAMLHLMGSTHADVLERAKKKQTCCLRRALTQ